MKTTLWVTLVCLGGLMSASAQLRISHFDREGTLAFTNSAEFTGVEVQHGSILDLTNWVTITNFSPPQASNTVQVDLGSSRYGFFRLRGTTTNGMMYSVNVVGFAHLTFKRGYNLVGNPFTQGSNTLAEIFPPDCGLPEDTFVVTWDPTRGVSGQPDGISMFYPGYGWEHPVFPLPPGRGFMLYIDPVTAPNPQCVVTMIGEVKMPTLVCNNVIYGSYRYNLLSSSLPIEGKLSTVLGLRPEVDDVVILWNSNATPPGFGKTFFYLLDAGWTDMESLIEPELGIGEAFWLLRPSPGTSTWCRRIEFPLP